MRTVRVIDSSIAYTETGTGDVPVVFLHGSPTSSYIWRNVIPHVTGKGRILAPDLIGMGASGKPDIGYRFADHARYLDAWFEALDLDEVVLVGHDWGGALGMDWATRHPGRVRGIAVLETFLRPQMWAELPPDVVEHSKALRTAGLGERMLLEENFAIEGALPHPFAIKTGLAPADHDVYRAPYPDPASRRPLLAWPREIPFDREPADVAERMDAYGTWLSASPEVPKLLLTVEDGVGIASPQIVAWAHQHIAALEVEGIGPAGHQAPEDQPDAIGRALSRWLDRHQLTQAVGDHLAASRTARSSSASGTPSSR